MNVEGSGLLQGLTCPCGQAGRITPEHFRVCKMRGHAWVHDMIVHELRTIILHSRTGAVVLREAKGQQAGHYGKSGAEQKKLNKLGGDLRVVGKWAEGKVGVIFEVKTISPNGVEAVRHFEAAMARHEEGINENTQQTSTSHTAASNAGSSARGRGRGAWAARAAESGRGGRGGRGRGRGQASAARATPYWAPGPRKLIASVNVEQLVSTVRNHRDATAASLLGMDHVPFVVLRAGGFSKGAYAALVQMFAGQKDLQHGAQVRWSCRTYLDFVIKRLAVTTVNQDWYNTRECMRAAA